MDCKLVVEIRVPVGDGTNGNVGTGYLVGQNRILTARHVLFPENFVKKGISRCVAIML